MSREGWVSLTLGLWVLDLALAVLILFLLVV